MNVIVYAEGRSDKLAMEALLQPLIQAKQEQGVSIEFFETAEGDRKQTLLAKIPIRAANILLNERDAHVVALPDLYPKNKGFPHETVDELVAGTRVNFRRALQMKGLADDNRFLARFHVFCFKHDLEALLLAAPGALASHLKVKSLPVTWTIPVEEQNHKDPPKRVVERLFAEQGQKYKDTVDAELILTVVRYQDIAAACPQCFAPFVAFLEQLG